MGFLQSALEANKEIYDLLKSKKDDSIFSFAHPEDEKGAGGDRSLVVDLIAEEIFVKHLKSYGKIFSEESGAIGEGEKTIILDPIDGSSNIASHFPYYGSSVTLKKKKKAKISVVANFANGDYFVKTPKEAYCGNFETDVKKPIKKKNNPAQIGIFEKAYKNSKFTKKIKKLGFKFRTPGAMALSLAYGHRVNFVIFEGIPREYDIIGGLHLCDDLNTFVGDGIIIVSKDKKTFKKLKKSLV